MVAFWFWDLNVVVYVSPRSCFRFHIEKQKVRQNILNYVKEYFNYSNLYNSYPYKAWIRELE